MQGIEHRQERQDQGRAEQNGQQRAERVRQVLEEGVDEGVLAAGLGAGGSLDIIVRGGGARLHRRQVVDLVKDGLHRTADDDLVAVARLGDGAEDAINGLDTVLVDDRRVVEFKAQTRRAVGEVGDVAGTTDRIEDFLCRVGHGGLLPWMRIRR